MGDLNVESRETISNAIIESDIPPASDDLFLVIGKFDEIYLTLLAIVIIALNFEPKAPKQFC